MRKSKRNAICKAKRVTARFAPLEQFVRYVQKVFAREFQQGVYWDEREKRGRVKP